MASTARPASRPETTADLVRAASGTAAIVATVLAGLLAVAGGSAQDLTILLALAQTGALLWFAARGYDEHRRWAVVTVVIAASWALAFTVPCWIFVLDPSLLDRLSPTAAVGLTNLALAALIAGHEGMLAARPRLARPSPERVRLDRVDVSRPRAWAWVAVGLLAMGVLFARNGGPIHWVSNLDKIGDMAKGLTYVVVVALAMKYVAVAIVAERLARLRRMDRVAVALLVGCIGVIMLLGARIFVATLLVQILLLHALLVRPAGLRRLVPALLVGIVVLIFGAGTVKRYQTFRAASPQLDHGFVDYATGRAPSELAGAYANNYADGVRLTGMARAIVPDEAGYGFGRSLLQLAVQPIPSPIRPTISTPAAVRPLVDQKDGNTYALPLQATAYLELGVAGVVGVLAFVGALLPWLESWLRRDRMRLSTLITLVAVLVEIPFVLRGGIPRGIAVATLELIGTWVVARTVLRSVSPS